MLTKMTPIINSGAGVQFKLLTHLLPSFLLGPGGVDHQSSEVTDLSTQHST